MFLENSSQLIQNFYIFKVSPSFIFANFDCLADLQGQGLQIRDSMLINWRWGADQVGGRMIYLKIFGKHCIGVFARPALASPHIVVCTETDMAAFILPLIISFWKYCPQSDPSREGLRSQVSECLNYYLLCEKVNWGRASLTSSHWRASLQCASTSQSVLPSVLRVLVCCLQFSKLIQPTNTEPANIGCIIN